MNLYLVIVPDDGGIDPAAVKQKFGDAQEIVPDRVWAIGTDLDTCGKVADALGMGVKPAEPMGLVFRMTDGDGYYFMAFWDALDAMRKR